MPLKVSLLKLIINNSLPEMISKKVSLNLTHLKEITLDSEKMTEFHRDSAEYFEINLNRNSKKMCDCFVKIEKLSICLKIINSLNQNCFKSCVHLREINLNFCGIFFIGANCFADLNNLQVLNLSSNKLTKLHLNTFKNLKKLESLNLSCNKLETLKAGLFQAQINLKFLDFSFNRRLKLENNALENLINLEELHMPEFELIGETLLLSNINKLKSLNVFDTKYLTDLHSKTSLEQLKLGNFFIFP